MKPKCEKKIDWFGICLQYALPLFTFYAAGFSLLPFLMPSKYNYVNSFVIHVLNFDSEKTRLWFLFRIIHSLVIFIDCFLLIGTYLLHAILASLLVHFQNSWLSHLVTAICSQTSVYNIFGFYNALGVQNSTFRSIVSFLTPLLNGFIFSLTIICNVIALSMFLKMDTIIYMLCVNVGIIFFLIAITVLRVAAKSFESSANCIEKLKHLMMGRDRKINQRVLKSLRLIGFEMGGFYLISMDMVIIYGYHMIDKTITAVILR